MALFPTKIKRVQFNKGKHDTAGGGLVSKGRHQLRSVSEAAGVVGDKRHEESKCRVCVGEETKQEPSIFVT